VARRRWNHTSTSYDPALEERVRKPTMADVNAVMRKYGTIAIAELRV